MLAVAAAARVGGGGVVEGWQLPLPTDRSRVVRLAGADPRLPWRFDGGRPVRRATTLFPPPRDRVGR